MLSFEASANSAGSVPAKANLTIGDATFCKRHLF
jgi:hypothetical protein